MKDEGLNNKRHTLAHILAMAVLEKFPDAKLGIGPVIDTGFYYDFKLPRPISDEDLPSLQKTMVRLLKEKLSVAGREISADEARELFKNQQYKLELIEEYVKEGRKLSVYSIGGFSDLCGGGHVKNTGAIDPGAFALTQVAGAYWRGSEKNSMLTRIYGAAFNTKKELMEHLARLTDAKQYDHRKLGKMLDLFVFSDLVGPGFPLFTPKGTVVRDALDDYVWELRKAAGYDRVDIPHLTKKELYEKSGHWDKFSNELFRITTREGHELAVKPMNCPHHIQIFTRHPASYREMPVRYANTTKVYRDEQTGELLGLVRVRSITQDDAHVFCRKAQIAGETQKIWEIVMQFYKRLGFDLDVRLSLRDPSKPQDYIGEESAWESAEEKLRSIIKENGRALTENVGEAAFYGPKIDFIAQDSLGRKWQVATIQLDMNLPERFDLTCINEKGEKERVVMIHAAIAGALERLMGILLEHYKGAFPFWLAPVQAGILPINDKNESYVAGIERRLTEAGIRFETDNRNDSISKKIREAELQKIPYLLIIGDKEAKEKIVSVRERGKGDNGHMTLEKFLNIKK